MDEDKATLAVCLFLFWQVLFQDVKSKADFFVDVSKWANIGSCK